MMLNLAIIPGRFSILRFDRDKSIPQKLLEEEIFVVVRTDEELSIVCLENVDLGMDAQHRDDGWSCIKVLGPLDLSMTGVAASITKPLAEAQVNIFAISTFDTDYILVKADKLSIAQKALSKAGFTFV